MSYDAPDGWYLNFPFLPIVCVNAGQTDMVSFSAYMGPGTSNNLPSGTSGVVTISLSEYEKGEISDSDSARITRRRLPAMVSIFNPTFYLRPNGDSTSLEISVVDDQNVAVADGTYVSLLASSGTISPTAGTTQGGLLQATFTSGPAVGTELVTATTFNGISATTEIEVGNPKPSQITLHVSQNHLPPNGTSQATLTATVTDRWGNPVPGQEVHIGVEEDGQYGLIAGGEVAEGVTDANGQFSVVFTSGDLIGTVGVRAELYYDKGAGPEVVQTDRKVIVLGSRLYLAIVVK